MSLLRFYASKCLAQWYIIKADAESFAINYLEDRRTRNYEMAMDKEK